MLRVSIPKTAVSSHKLLNILEAFNFAAEKSRKPKMLCRVGNKKITMKNLKAIAVIVLAASLMSLIAPGERGRSFTPNYKGWYYLRTQFTGDDLSLESNGAASTYMNGGSFMSSQKGASGTMWQFVPDAANVGWYRLKSKDQGNNKCLEANGKDSPVHGGAAFMDDCKNVSGQLWRLDLVSSANGDHIYRLRSMSGGNNFSLEGNKPGGSKGGNAFMDNTQNVSGQMWRLVPTE